jgi:hypothetical protein
MRSDGRVLLYGQATVVALAVVFGNWMLSITCPDVHIDAGVASVFFSVLGIVYAILIGFAVYMVSNDFNEMRRCVFGEVNQLQNAWDYLSFVDNQEDVVTTVAEALKQHIAFILFREWPIMCSDEAVDISTPASMKSLMRAVNAIRITNHSDSVALEKLIDCVASAERYRVDRLVASRQRLPNLVYHLVVLLSVITVFIFSFLAIESLWINLALNGVNGFAIALVCLIIRDLDNPFRGAWRIDAIPFATLLDDWEKQRPEASR